MNNNDIINKMIEKEIISNLEKEMTENELERFNLCDSICDGLYGRGNDIYEIEDKLNYIKEAIENEIENKAKKEKILKLFDKLVKKLNK